MPTLEHSENALAKSNGEPHTSASQIAISTRLLRIGLKTIEFLAILLALLVILPAMLVLATISAISSSHGLYLDGKLTGNFDALAYIAVAVAIAVAMFRFRRHKSITATFVSTGISVILVIIAAIIILAFCLYYFIDWNGLFHGIRF